MQSPTEHPIRILLLEDKERDRELIAQTIARLVWDRVHLLTRITWSKNAYWAMSANCRWEEVDLVVADAMMPMFVSNGTSRREPHHGANIGSYFPIGGNGAQIREARVPRGFSGTEPNTSHGGMEVAKWLVGAGSSHRPESLRFILTTAVSAGLDLAREADAFEAMHPWFVMVPKPEDLQIDGADTAFLPTGIFEGVLAALIVDRARADWGLRLFHAEHVAFRDPFTRRLILGLWREIERAKATNQLWSLAITGERLSGRSTVAQAMVRIFRRDEDVAGSSLLIANANTTAEDLEGKIRGEKTVLWLVHPERLSTTVMAHLHSMISIRTKPARLIILEAESVPEALQQSKLAEFRFPPFAKRTLDYPGIFAAALSDHSSMIPVTSDLENRLVNERWSNSADIVEFARYCTDRFGGGQPIPVTALDEWREGRITSPSCFSIPDPYIATITISKLEICLAGAGLEAAPPLSFAKDPSKQMDNRPEWLAVLWAMMEFTKRGSLETWQNAFHAVVQKKREKFGLNSNRNASTTAATATSLWKMLEDAEPPWNLLLAKVGPEKGGVMPWRRRPKEVREMRE
jgi:CheY-like chemotaxis protein